MKLYKHPFALLEVLIAFALIALCALPLIYPHVFIMQSERKFTSTVELDHLVNLLYANILQKLYQNEIPWQSIEEGNEIPIDSQLLQSIHYKGDPPFTGVYKFTKLRQRPRSKDAEKSAYLYQLEFIFSLKPGYFFEKIQKDNTQKLTYRYQIAMERNRK